MMNGPLSMSCSGGSIAPPLGDPGHDRNQDAPDSEKVEIKNRHTTPQAGLVKQRNGGRIQEQHATKKDGDQPLFH